MVMHSALKSAKKNVGTNSSNDSQKMQPKSAIWWDKSMFVLLDEINFFDIFSNGTVAKGTIKVFFLIELNVDISHWGINGGTTQTCTFFLIFEHYVPRFGSDTITICKKLKGLQGNKIISVWAKNTTKNERA